MPDVPFGFAPAAVDPNMIDYSRFIRPGVVPWGSWGQPVNQDAALAATMTHHPEASNPAAPYLQAARDFARAGITGVMRGRGADMPAWSNQVGDVLTSEPANWAIGMAPPLGMASSAAMALARKYVPLMTTEKTAQAIPEELSGLRPDLTTLAWEGKEGLAASREREQHLVDAIRRRMTDYFRGDETSGRISPDMSSTIPGYHWENGKLVEDAPPESQPLLRQVTSRSRSGRPIGPPFRMGEDVNQAILEAGYNRVEPAPPPSFQAYHGSPHDFERFDLSKIGTGEGAQAYGHGLYFAEEPETAEYYKQALSTKPALEGKPLLDQHYNTVASTGNTFLDETIRKAFGDMGLARKDLEAGIQTKEESDLPVWKNYAAKRIADSKAALEKLDELEASGKLGAVSPGKTYQVAIKADPEHFLDWDKPLSEQSEKVQEALKGLGQSAGNKYLPRTGETAIKSLKTDMGSHEKAAEALRSAGIPGIKYLDQGSRAAGEGSRNYVVFDDKLVDILKKYGLAGLGILPAAGAFQSSPDRKPFGSFAPQ